MNSSDDDVHDQSVSAMGCMDLDDDDVDFVAGTRNSGSSFGDGVARESALSPGHHKLLRPVKRQSGSGPRHLGLGGSKQGSIASSISQSTKVMDNLSGLHHDFTNSEFLDLSEFMDPLQASMKDISPELLEKIGNPTIEDDTPAAAAIRANAQVKVGRVSKAARGVNAQAVRKMMKKATFRGHFGTAKGKPPRVPPPQHAGDESLFLWEDDESDDDDEDWKSCRSATYSNEDLDNSPELLGQSGRSQRTFNSQSQSQSQGNQNYSESQPHSQVSFSDNVEVIKPVTRDSSSSRPSGLSNDSSRYVIPRVNESSRYLEDTGEVVAGTVEESNKVLGHYDPHDLLKLKRKKKKGTKKLRKNYVKGKVIDGQHEKYMLSIAIMLGVRTSIANLNAQLHASPKRKALHIRDFLKTEKYEFSPKGSDKTPPHQLSHTFKFKDYSPVVFAYLRRLFGVNEYDFLLSVCGNANFIEFISNAKSGQFFFYSNDGKYMIKTMTNSESKFLRRILPGYFRHCTENPNTLLTKFLGMYRVKLYHLRRNMKFVIMNSVYYTDKYIHSFFDLKGSVTGRDAKPDEVVKKDNDLRRMLPDDAFALPTHERERVRRQIVLDCGFLKSVDVMDYSMLVGVHYIPVHHGSRSMNKAKVSASKRKLNVEKDQFLNERESFFRDSRSAGGDTLGPPPAIYDDVLDDDDCSYIEGSQHRPLHSEVVSQEAERRKQQTIERIYWPYHRLFDLHGHRIMRPRTCTGCGSTRCECDDDDDVIDLGPFFKMGVPEFVSPLSDRKDGGFVMDTEGLDLPRKCKHPRGEFLYEGKIFYMGIIDILQQYNNRKRIEANYHAWNGGRLDASCVPPDEYARRFVKFFDQYATRDYAKKNGDGKIRSENGVEVTMAHYISPDMLSAPL